MYHSISETPYKGVHPYFAIETSPKVFEAQIKYLHANGYTGISTTDIIRLLGDEKSDRKKYVALTFDDGYRDFYTHAFPILSKYGFMATAYLPSAYIGHRSRQFLDKDCLTWREVRELHRSGIVIGSHTASHAKLDGVPELFLEQEIRGSKEAIEQEIGTSISSFAYPYGFPDHEHGFVHRLRDALKAAGYRDGVSKVIGTKQSLEERYFLRRVPVNTADQISLFAAKLQGDYDWLHGAQSIMQSLKRMWPKFHSRPVPGHAGAEYALASISDSAPAETPSARRDV
jgi:peptidoglycan/xylan/chitin deacetylase (PgdA/CDA1 family)